MEPRRTCGLVWCSSPPPAVQRNWVTRSTTTAGGRSRTRSTFRGRLAIRDVWPATNDLAPRISSLVAKSRFMAFRPTLIRMGGSTRVILFTARSPANQPEGGTLASKCTRSIRTRSPIPSSLRRSIPPLAGVALIIRKRPVIRSRALAANWLRWMTETLSPSSKTVLISIIRLSTQPWQRFSVPTAPL